MRLLALFSLLTAGVLADPAPAPAPAPARTREQFIAALRAEFDGKVDLAGNTCKVLVDEEAPFKRGIWIQQGTRSKTYPSSKLVPGDPAPEIVCEAWLQTAGGPPVTKDKVVWIEFSATWCGPCMESMPHVQELYAKHRDKGLEVIVVTDEPSKVFMPYLSKKRYTMPAATGTDRKAIRANFGVSMWPTAILVGRDGKVAYVGDPRDTGLEKAIETLLAR